MNTITLTTETGVKFEAYTDDKGVIRWPENKRVPFDDLLERNGISRETRALCAAARAEETKAVLKNYRRRQRRVKPSAEEMFEMRAAFGTGTTVVNVITGRRTKL